MLNKRASEKVISIAYILYLAIIGIGVMVIMAQYVNSPVDVRPLEVKALYSNIFDCLTENGFVKEEVMNDNFDIYSFCNLRKDIFKPSKEDIAKDFLWFSFSFVDEKGVLVRSALYGGNSNYQLDCESEINVGKTSEHYSFCVFGNESYNYVAKDGDVKRLKIVALVSSNNRGERRLSSLDVKPNKK
jgi:hypothetical protein